MSIVEKGPAAAATAGAGEEPETSATSTEQGEHTVRGLGLHDLKAHPQRRTSSIMAAPHKPHLHSATNWEASIQMVN